MNWTEDAKFWHKLWSMRLTILTAAYAAAAGAWVTIPGDWKPHVPGAVQAALAILGVLLPASVAVARVIDQPKLKAGGSHGNGP